MDLRAGLARRDARAQLADRGLIPFADQLEHARALRDVVVRLGGARLPRAQLAAQAQELAPRTRRGARLEPRLDLRQSALGLLHAIGREQRFGGDQFRFDRLGRWRIGRLRNLVGDRQRFIRVAAARRETRR